MEATSSKQRKNSEDFSGLNERIKSEYSKNNKVYEPYKLENTMLYKYEEIKKYNKSSNDFLPVTSKTKVKPNDQLVMVTDDEEFIFFNSLDNLATGYIDGPDYRDTILFDHSTNNAFVHRRKFCVNETRSSITILEKNFKPKTKTKENKTKIDRSEVVDEDDENNVKQYIGSAINHIDQQLNKIQLEKQKDEKKPRKPRKKADIVADSNPEES